MKNFRSIVSPQKRKHKSDLLGVEPPKKYFGGKKILGKKKPLPPSVFRPNWLNFGPAKKKAPPNGRKFKGGPPVKKFFNVSLKKKNNLSLTVAQITKEKLNFSPNKN